MRLNGLDYRSLSLPGWIHRALLQGGRWAPGVFSIGSVCPTGFGLLENSGVEIL